MAVSRSLATLAAVAAAVGIATSAFAGPIILRNEDIPNICGLEVSVGPNAPDAPVRQFGDLQPMWEQQFDADKICYRVSEPNDQCGTWSDWRCCESSGGETLCSVD